MQTSPSPASHSRQFAYVGNSSTDTPDVDHESAADTQETQLLANVAKKSALLVIEDHASFVDGMRPELAKEYDVTDVCSKEEFFDAIAQRQYALAVVDLTLDKRLEGLELMPYLKQAGIKFLIFSGTAEDWHILAAIRFGALGYVNKRKNLDVVSEALHTIAQGGVAFPPEIVKKMRLRKSEQFPALGPAETQLIDILVAKRDPSTGNIPSNKFIADQLDVTLNRVEGIIRELLAKFKIKGTSRALLLHELKERGYFPGVPKDSFDEFGIKL